jgi:hypothetical protein
MNLAVRKQLASERQAMVLMLIFDTHEDRPRRVCRRPDRVRQSACLPLLGGSDQRSRMPLTSGFFMRWLICPGSCRFALVPKH